MERVAVDFHDLAAAERLMVDCIPHSEGDTRGLLLARLRVDVDTRTASARPRMPASACAVAVAATRASRCARAPEHATAARFRTASRDTATASAFLPASAGKARRAQPRGLAQLGRNLVDEARYRVRRRLAENLALLRAREVEHLSRTGDRNVGEPALLLNARSIVHAVHMREKRFLHTRREHAVELEAL